MSTFEETIEATLNADGQIVLSRPTTAPPGPIQVTIRTAASAPSEKPAIREAVADVIRRIAARQRRGIPWPDRGGDSRRTRRVQTG